MPQEKPVLTEQEKAQGVYLRKTVRKGEVIWRKTAKPKD